MQKKSWISRLTALALGLSVFFAGFASSSFAVGPVHLSLNGEELFPQVNPLLREQRAYVELNSVLRALGYTVSYEPASRKVLANKDKRQIVLQAGSKTVSIDDHLFAMPSPPFIHQGRTMIAVHSLAQITLLEANWNRDKNGVELSSKLHPAPLQLATLQDFSMRQVKIEAYYDTAGRAVNGSPIYLENTLPGDSQHLRVHPKVQLELIKATPQGLGSLLVKPSEFAEHLNKAKAYTLFEIHFSHGLVTRIREHAPL